MSEEKPSAELEDRGGTKDGAREGRGEELSRRSVRDERERDEARGGEGRDRAKDIGRDMFREVPGRDGRPDFDRGGRDFRGGGRGGGPEWRGGGRGRGMDGPMGRGGFRGAGRGFGSLAMGREEPVETLDREQVCPMLLRIFCKFNDFHDDAEFSFEKQPLDDEVRVHTWRDATLGELTELLAQMHRPVRQSGTRVSFKVVYPDANGKFTSHQLGSTAVGRRLPDDAGRRTLGQIRFQVGDFLAVAIYPARSGYNKAVAAAGAEQEGQEKEEDRRRKREPGEDDEEERGEKGKEGEEGKGGEEPPAAEAEAEEKKEDAMEKEEDKPE